MLPDGCMDLYVAGDYRFHTSGAMIAGPDTVANLSGPSPERLTGLRFRPGVLPRLLGVPAHELRDRRCRAVYGYGPSTLRRVLRFRRAVALMRSGHPLAAVAADAGYSDQPHLHREAREFSGLPLSTLAADQLGRGANTSMDVPSGSVTVA